MHGTLVLLSPWVFGFEDQTNAFCLCAAWKRAIRRISAGSGQNREAGLAELALLDDWGFIHSLSECVPRRVDGLFLICCTWFLDHSRQLREPVCRRAMIDYTVVK